MLDRGTVTRSEEFRGRWAAHNVQIQTTGIELIHHPIIGELDLPGSTGPVPSYPDAGQAFVRQWFE